MPEAHTIAEMIPQPVLGPDDKYVKKSGREIYEELSITGLNRSPIEILTSFIIADSTLSDASPVWILPGDVEAKRSEKHTWKQRGGKPLNGSIWPEIPLEKMCEHALVDGSFALRLISEKEMQGNEKLDEPYEFLPDCIEIHRRLVTQELRDKDGHLNGITRVWQQTNTDWVTRDVKNYAQTNEQVLNTARYPLEAFYPHPYGKGILFPNQKTFRRLEEIEEGVRANTGPAALSLIVTGYAGDWKRAQDTFAKGAKVIGIPGSANVTRVAANNTTSDLLQSKGGLVRGYLQNMHLIEVSETSTMSGRARKLAMMPMLNYVALIRTMLDDIYEFMGYEVHWGGLDVADPEELTAQLDFLERGRSGQYLSVEECATMARALYGLTGKPMGTLEEPEPEPEPEIVPDENMNPTDTGVTEQ